VDILAAEQTPDNPRWFQGTADAVRQILHHLEAYPSEYILILSGDQLYQMDFKAMLQHHIDTKAEISIATIPVAAREASEFGILKADENTHITSFIEKPKPELLPDWVSDTGAAMQQQDRNYLASMGIYIFNRDLLFNILRKEMAEATDFGKEIMPQNIGSRRVVSYQFEGYWTDIGNVYSFYEANIALTDDIPPFNLFCNLHPIFTRSRSLPPAKISGTTLESTIVAEGSIIMASRIEKSVLGVRSRVGHGTTIVGTYVMGNDAFESLEDMKNAIAQNVPVMGIGERCYIANAIIDKNCRIGSDVRIIGGLHRPNVEHELYTIKDGIVVVKKGATLPNGFVI
jgi:glucose-1-phosphate adenylyltransferase